MEPTLPVESKPGLEDVRVQFEKWRRIRGRRRAIPESLWVSAVSLYPEVSPNRISRTLRLNHTALKRYVQERFTR